MECSDLVYHEDHDMSQKRMHHRDTETQRLRRENTNFYGFSLCLCASVVPGFIHA